MEDKKERKDSVAAESPEINGVCVCVCVCVCVFV